MANLLAYLPLDSNTKRAEQGPPPWTETEALLASFLHSFHLWAWARGGRKGPKPQPIDSPPERRRKAVKRQSQYGRLVAQAEAVRRQKGG